MSDSESIVEDLTSQEKSKLIKCETIIERGQKTQFEVGSALQTIRDEKLYRETHSTFEDYCLSRWDMTDSRANQLIAAFRVTTVVVEIKNEAQARELAPLLGQPDELRAVWMEANEVTGGMPTAKVIARIRSERLEALRRPKLSRTTPEAEPVAWEKLKKRESEKILREQRNALEDWTLRLEGQAKALVQTFVDQQQIHPDITSTERDQWLERLRTARTNTTKLIRKLERAPVGEAPLVTDIPDKEE